VVPAVASRRCAGDRGGCHPEGHGEELHLSLPDGRAEPDRHVGPEGRRLDSGRLRAGRHGRRAQVSGRAYAGGLRAPRRRGDRPFLSHVGARPRPRPDVDADRSEPDRRHRLDRSAPRRRRGDRARRAAHGRGRPPVLRRAQHRQRDGRLRVLAVALRAVLRAADVDGAHLAHAPRRHGPLRAPLGRAERRRRGAPERRASREGRGRRRRLLHAGEDAHGRARRQRALLVHDRRVDALRRHDVRELVPRREEAARGAARRALHPGDSERLGPPLEHLRDGGQQPLLAVQDARPGARQPPRRLEVLAWRDAGEDAPRRDDRPRRRRVRAHRRPPQRTGRSRPLPPHVGPPRRRRREGRPHPRRDGRHGLDPEGGRLVGEPRREARGPRLHALLRARHRLDDRPPRRPARARLRVRAVREGRGLQDSWRQEGCP